MDHKRPGRPVQTVRAMFLEQRSEPREALALPVKLADGAQALTRDISASGMYLEIPGAHEVLEPLHFEMDIEQPRMRFTAEGHIVRIEHHDGNTGIAVKLVSPRLDLLD
jgi:hypothetical protein